MVHAYNPELDKNKNCTIFEASLVYTVKIQATKIYSETLSQKQKTKSNRKKKNHLDHTTISGRKSQALDFKVIINKDEREARDGSFICSSYLPI